MSRKYIYTDKIHTYKGIMSTVLGIINNTAIGHAIYLTFKLGGEAPMRYAATLVLILILAFVGIILGLVGKAETEKFYFFAYLGLVLNVLAIVCISGVLYAGAYGL